MLNRGRALLLNADERDWLYDGLPSRLCKEMGESVKALLAKAAAADESEGFWHVCLFKLVSPVGVEDKVSVGGACWPVDPKREDCPCVWIGKVPLKQWVKQPAFAWHAFFILKRLCEDEGNESYLDIKTGRALKFRFLPGSPFRFARGIVDEDKA